MILDSKDLLILKEFCKLADGEKVSAWKIMKVAYPKGKDKEYQVFKRRLKKMEKYGFFFIDDGEYILIRDRVVFKRFSFPNKIRNGIALLIDNKWEILEI